MRQAADTILDDEESTDKNAIGQLRAIEEHLEAAEALLEGISKATAEIQSSIVAADPAALNNLDEMQVELIDRVTEVFNSDMSAEDIVSQFGEGLNGVMAEVVRMELRTERAERKREELLGMLQSQKQAEQTLTAARDRSKQAAEKISIDQVQRQLNPQQREAQRLSDLTARQNDLAIKQDMLASRRQALVEQTVQVNARLQSQQSQQNAARQAQDQISLTYKMLKQVDAQLQIAAKRATGAELTAINAVIKQNRAIAAELKTLSSQLSNAKNLAQVTQLAEVVARKAGEAAINTNSITQQLSKNNAQLDVVKQMQNEVSRLNATRQQTQQVDANRIAQEAAKKTPALTEAQRLAANKSALDAQRPQQTISAKLPEQTRQITAPQPSARAPQPSAKLPEPTIKVTPPQPSARAPEPSKVAAPPQPTAKLPQPTKVVAPPQPSMRLPDPEPSVRPPEPTMKLPEPSIKPPQPTAGPKDPPATPAPTRKPVTACKPPCGVCGAGCGGTKEVFTGSEAMQKKGTSGFKPKAKPEQLIKPISPALG